MLHHSGVGAQRKFSGLIDFRDGRFERVVTLSATKKGEEQRVRLNEGTTLTVLPAYHDDVLTKEMTVGLGFELSCGDTTRRLVLTSDTGLYPRLEDKKGEPLYYDSAKKRPKLDTGEGKALYEVYPDQFKQPDLAVVHIGSIKKRELDPPVPSDDREPGLRYYPNHLGALGTLTMLHQLRPKVALISEFGAELKGFHIELVDKIARALRMRQEDDQAIERRDEGKARTELSFVAPGDLTIAYDIAAHRLLCADDGELRDPAELTCRAGRGYRSVWDKGGKQFKARGLDDEWARKAEQRAYLFRRDRKPSETEDNRLTESFYEKIFNHRLPFHKPPAEDDA